MSDELRRKIKSHTMTISIINLCIIILFFSVKKLIEFNTSPMENQYILFAMSIMTLIIIPTLYLSTVIILIMDYLKERRTNSI